MIDPSALARNGRPWQNWLILAGRGFGKTRTGAEWVRQEICGPTPLAAGRRSHIAIIAETAKDARDVMIGDGRISGEGSGLLQVFPKDYRPLYEPSKRRLTCPNGAVLSIFNGSEPDQLRGPNFDAAWCLAGHTLIAMADGSSKELVDITVGDLVASRSGPRRVIASGKTGKNAETLDIRTSSGLLLEATKNHKIWTARGWIPAGDLRVGDALCRLDASTFSKTPSPTRSGMLGIPPASRISDFANILRRPAFMPAAASIAIAIVGFVICSAKAGALVSKWWRSSRQMRDGRTASAIGLASCAPLAAISSIPRMAAKAFPIPRRWSEPGLVKLPKSASQSTWRSFFHRMLGPKLWLVDERHWIIANPLMLGALAVEQFSTSRASRSLENSVQHCVLKNIDQQHSNQNSAFVLMQPVAAHTPRPDPLRSFAQGDATPISMEAEPVRNANLLATIVRACSSQHVQMQDSAVDNVPCGITDHISSVSKSATRCDVYDIAVEGAHEFFANGILVHNCDELAKWSFAQDTWDQLQFGLRLGNNPQCLISTTPRPIKLIKDILADQGTITTRGSTLENANNLAPQFVDTIRHKYEGTRLGRQEIYAEILDDVPGALWQRARIDELRVKPWEVPPLIRIVVAIDPAVTSGEDADETGIIAAGIDAKGHAYILEDGSGNFQPADWAQRAIAIYRARNADRIIGETNNGGEMIANTIRVIDPSISYRGVHASRGKVIRAEPVSALYERDPGLVHHVGAFPQLEDQMCAFTQDFDRKTAGYSPDRVDSLVWALSELMIKVTRPAPFFGSYGR